MDRFSDPKYSNQEEIVISGISGRFPESDNIEEFTENLFNGVDLITEDERRWPPDMFDMPRRSGKLKSISKFDADFFGVNLKFADKMDPQQRIFLELTYEAIIDAGLNPSELRGSRTGVFIGITESESNLFCRQNITNSNGFFQHHRSMTCNWVSFAFDFKGPSYSVDSACSSSFMALHNAVQSIKNGECDAAIVGGMNLCLDPAIVLQIHYDRMVSPDGQSKPFDVSANGYARAEAIVAVFIQKVSSAKRVYASIIGTKTITDGNKIEGVTYPSGKMQNQLLQEIYSENGVDPLHVSYIEAHCTGTQVGDPEESNSITNFFCNNRQDPLLIGSVKSNMGHAEPASGLCSLAKVLISMQNNLIPATINYKTPNPRIPALLDGRLKVVSKNTPWAGGIVGISSIGVGGTNVHCILNSNQKPKIETIDLNPRIIGVSGRTSAAVSIFLNYIETHKDDKELLALVHDIHKYNIHNHIYRGYICLKEKPITEISKVSPQTRPIWFIYSGVGSQWPGMGTSLMKIESIKTSIMKSAQILKPYGIDLEDIVTNPAESTFDTITNISLGSIAIQIALTDLLVKVLELKPDGFIGHSTGETLCGYADGTLTHEEALLVGYACGCAFTEDKNAPGAMAAVGLTWDEANLQCPSDVYPVCHNSVNNVTISGPQQSVENFVKDQKEKNVFAKKISNCNIAFHSKYVADKGPGYLKQLAEIIQNPKVRSKRWISTSIPETDWGSELAKTGSPAYYAHNSLSPVLFYQGLQHVPDNAICIEIGASGLLQGILRKTLNPGTTNISLVNRDHTNNEEHLLSALGKIYNAGAQPRLEKLYVPVSFPVGKGTPTISSFIRWDHSIDWTVAKFLQNNTVTGNVTEIDLNLADMYLSGHNIDGRIIYPTSEYLILVWKALAKSRNTVFEKLAVVFEDLTIHQAIILSDENPSKLFVKIFKTTNKFEILESESVIVTGQIKILSEIIQETKDYISQRLPNEEPPKMKLTKNDIYKELRLRGYEYHDSFQGIGSADIALENGQLEWNNNWSTYIDAILQFSMLREKYLRVPTQIRSVVIDPRQQMPGPRLINVTMDHNLNCVKADGVEVQNLQTSIISRRNNQKLAQLKTYSFAPYEDLKQRTTNETLSFLLGIVFENTKVRKFKITEINMAVLENHLIAKLKIIAEEEFFVVVEAKILETHTFSDFPADVELISTMEYDQNLVFVKGVYEEDIQDVLLKHLPFLSQNGFILVESTKKLRELSGLIVVTSQVTPLKHYTLFKRPVRISFDSAIIKISCDNFDWLEPLKTALAKSENDDSRIYLYAHGPKACGIIGLANSLIQEPGGSSIRTVFIENPKADTFTISKYLNQLQKDLFHNVLRGTTWGSFRYLPLNHETERNVPEAFVGKDKVGYSSTLKWIEGSINLKKNIPGMELCKVFYAELNSHNLMVPVEKFSLNVLSLSKQSSNGFFGLGFSGTDSKGRKIMGIAQTKNIATSVFADSHFLCEAPDSWTFAQAATVPIVYSTIYYAVIIKGQLQPGESILIHSGTEDLGRAAISIALSIGCKIFTTDKTEEKRIFLKTLFPQLTDNCIGHCQNSSFEDLIDKQTNGRGVDVVLISPTTEFLNASVRCLSFGGRFIDLGKAGVTREASINLQTFPTISFIRISLDSLFYEHPSKKIQITSLVKDGIKKGVVQPIVSKIFEKGQLDEAFQYSANGGHIGKVLIKIREEEDEMVSAVPRTYFNSEKTYIFVGGLGGMGLELVKWCIQRQATKIVINSRNGIKTGYQELCVQRFEEQGAKILISTDDATTQQGAEDLLKSSLQLGPIGAIFNLALVLSDAMLSNQTVKHFDQVCKPKIAITKNLDITSRSLAPDLDHFVCFSSIVSGCGNFGQANYGFANSTMEQICAQRRKSNLPGLAIQWGLVDDVGFVAENQIRNIAEHVPQKISSCLAALDIFLQNSEAIVSSVVLKKEAQQKDLDKSKTISDIVANILGFEDVSSIPEMSTLFEFGLDSLQTTEIQKVLEQYLDYSWKREDVRHLTFAELKKIDAKK